MNVAEAAKVFEETKREMERLKPLLETSSDVLKEYFRKNDKRDYRGRIGFSVGSRRILDSNKIKAELGDRLDDFKKVIQTESLTLLKP